jgi:hypothetical protein
VLRLERRISRDGMVSVGGNFYSVPNTAQRKRCTTTLLPKEASSCCGCLMQRA